MTNQFQTQVAKLAIAALSSLLPVGMAIAQQAPQSDVPSWLRAETPLVEKRPPSANGVSALVPIYADVPLEANSAFLLRKAGAALWPARLGVTNVEIEVMVDAARNLGAHEAQSGMRLIEHKYYVSRHAKYWYSLAPSHCHPRHYLAPVLRRLEPNSLEGLLGLPAVKELYKVCVLAGHAAAVRNPAYRRLSRIR